MVGEDPFLLEVPAPVTTEVPAPVTTEVPAPVTAEVPATVSADLPAGDPGSSDGDLEKARDLDLPAAENSVDFAE